MPILTQGFRVNNMPQYTPVDPNLVAFNPLAATEGIKTSLNIKALLDKIAADRAAQEELAATRAGRIGSQNASANRSIATDTAFTPLAGLEASTRQGQLEQLNALFKPQTESMLAGLNLSKEQALAKSTLLPDETKLSHVGTLAGLQTIGPETNAKISDFTRNAAMADADLSLLGKATALRGQTMENQAGKLADEALLRPATTTLAGKELTDKINSFEEDKARKTRAEEAKIESIQASTKEALGHADYFLNGGAAKAPRPASQKLGELALTAQRIEKGPYVLPNGTTGDLSAYRAAVYDENGKPKTEGSVPFLPDALTPSGKMRQVKRDQNAEAAIKIMNGLQGVQNELVKQMANEFGASENNVATPPTSGNLPVLTPEQAAKMSKIDKFKGTEFIGTDGKKRVIK